MLRILENETPTCRRDSKSLAEAVPLLSVNKAVIYDKQHWNSNFPRNAFPYPKSLMIKLQKPTWYLLRQQIISLSDQAWTKSSGKVKPRLTD
jgi:hypothetical protein